MWEYEHAVETTVAPQALWGTTFAMIPGPGEEPINMRLTEVVVGKQFTDVCDFGGAIVTTAAADPTGPTPSR